MTNKGKGTKGTTPEKDSFSYYLKALLVVFLFYIVLTPILATAWDSDMDEDYEEKGLDSIELSKAVFEDYGVPFFILVFVLMAATVGGMYLAKDELRSRRWRD